MAVYLKVSPEGEGFNPHRGTITWFWVSVILVQFAENKLHRTVVTEARAVENAVVTCSCVGLTSAAILREDADVFPFPNIVGMAKSVSATTGNVDQFLIFKKCSSELAVLRDNTVMINAVLVGLNGATA